MILGGFRPLPVVEADGRVVGIVSIRDLMKVALDDSRAASYAPRGCGIGSDWVGAEASSRSMRSSSSRR